MRGRRVCPPANLVDDKLIRPAGVTGDAVHVDAVEFMATGGGRFADVARIYLGR